MFEQSEKINLDNLEKNLRTLTAEFKESKLSGYISNRKEFIVKWLKYNQIPFTESTILNQSDKIYYNIYVPILGTRPENRETIIFTAHHDVVNKDSNNVLDNSGSVINLLYLAKLLYKDKTLQKNIIIVFNDDEERPEKVGIKKMIELITLRQKPFQKINPLNIKFIVLDITTIGECLLIENSNTGLSNEIKNCHFNGNAMTITLPSNDAKYIRENYNYSAVCLSLIPEKHLSDKKTFWSQLHSLNDDFKNINSRQMSNLIYYLRKLARTI